VPEVTPIKRKEFQTLTDKSIFARIQIFTFSIFFYITLDLTLDLTCTSNQDIDIIM
jgi:hypothetical protein